MYHFSLFNDLGWRPEWTTAALGTCARSTAEDNSVQPATGNCDTVLQLQIPLELLSAALIVYWSVFWRRNKQLFLNTASTDCSTCSAVAYAADSTSTTACSAQESYAELQSTASRKSSGKCLLMYLSQTKHCKMAVWICTLSWHQFQQVSTFRETVCDCYKNLLPLHCLK